MAATAALAVIMAGATGYQAYQSSQAKSEAIDEKGKQEKIAEQQRMQAQAEAAKLKEDQTAATAQADQQTANAALIMQQRRKRTGIGGGNKGGTLLTGPSGLGSYSGGGGKTLLGM